MSENLILEKSTAYSVNAFRFCKILEQERLFVLANQFVRSASSIGANVWEAQHCESRPDFLHKMKIAAKEAAETKYWLIVMSKLLEEKMDFQLIEDLDEIIRLLSAIIITTRSRIKK